MRHSVVLLAFEDVTLEKHSLSSHRIMRQFPHSSASDEQSPNEGSSNGGAEIVQLDHLETIDCPCGLARRAFTGRDDFDASLHLTEICQTAQTHYHRRSTETYVVLECGPDAAIELDGNQHPVRPLSSVLIPPGVRHRAIGEMRVIIFCTPTFDPTDEFFD